MNRLIAIGDIHGQRIMLDDLLSQIEPTDLDLIVFLGDYIDRGPDSKGVIDDLIDFKLFYPQTIFLRGNHEQMFLDALIDCGIRIGERLSDVSPKWVKEISRYSDATMFKLNGGEQTLKSYGAELVMDFPGFTLLGEIPSDHIEFLEQTQMCFEHEHFVFVHAGINPLLPLEQQQYTLLWDRDLEASPSGKTVIIGHTPCPDGAPLIADDLIMLDTGAAYDGPLTAMDVLSGQVWQAKP
ncbi:serine/threonine protein phosphatase 1 [Malonomonas rubra DSM 5091]|uniref:Serine/threonine protein phosphatase 1 n=1 Tax=Malonomonas rubra DSM 5091 TaxID=1122189 RepID=A0A1M6H9T8_MALRU|nr:metallophosphoesterase family protein [Malonomonas rubra]SHJ19000.1 serine/threonine protein phosphatase 1 [Malonomonas rubra DSM 5091]